MKCTNCGNDEPLARVGGKMVMCAEHNLVNLTMSKSQYNYMIMTMEIEHGNEVADEYRKLVVR